MRKAAIVAVLVAALLMMTAGIALAETFIGTEKADTIRGTAEADRIEGLAGDDDIFGQGGGDTIFGNRGDEDIYAGDGRDRVIGGRGDDFIDVQGDGKVDRVDCGSGRDVVRANPEDRLDGNCEVSKSLEEPK